jgi:uncharacterized protein
MRRRAALLLLIAGLGLGAEAKAAEWDCLKPTGIAEPVPCADAELARLETQVTAALAAAAAKLSPPAQARLRDGQAAWRKYLGVLCLGEPQPGGAGMADCLKQEYDIRRAQLARAVENTGGMTFYRVERLEAHAPRLAEDMSRSVLTRIAWPQLDRAVTKAQRQWNETIAKTAEEFAVPLDRLDPDTDVAVDYQLDSVTPDAIQTIFSRDLYIHGAAHGDDTSQTSAFLLQPARPLVAEDLFDPAKPWAPTLAELAYRALADAAHSEAWQLLLHDPSALQALVAEPRSWLLGHDGLTLHFDPYDVAGYAAGSHDVLIPWPSLAPYLRAAPALRLPAQQATAR